VESSAGLLDIAGCKFDGCCVPDLLPSGDVTLLFTDIGGSTRLIEELGELGYVEALACIFRTSAFRLFFEVCEALIQTRATAYEPVCTASMRTLSVSATAGL